MEIKPCPLCGGTAVTDNDTVFMFKGNYVVCRSCNLSTGGYEHTDDAIEAWNSIGSAWQPIDTAPKDGSRILLFYSKSRKEGVTETAVGRWEIQKYHDRPRPYWENEKYIGDVSYKRENPPTHWMPLPSPPSP